MTILIPDTRGDFGERLQAQPGIQPWDAFDWLAVRENRGGRWYIPLGGFISPVIPLLLQMAKPDFEGELPVLVDLRDEPERFVECVRRWVYGHQNVRARLAAATKVKRWRKPTDVDRALTLAPSEYTVALQVWRRDPWCWRQEWT